MLFRFKKDISEPDFLKSRQVKQLNAFLVVHRLKLRSHALDRKVKVDIYLPADPSASRGTLFVNDGQDMGQLHLKETLTDLLKTKRLPEISVIAIHANEERMQEYGIAGFPDFKQRGKKADRYSDFVCRELIPFLQKEYQLMLSEPGVFAGFSMGGLTAMDIGWNNPHLFNKVGVFSGSFWWRSKNTGTAEDDKHRIMHSRIRESVKRDEMSFWMQTGTLDEKGDRNKNGIIDSIDDTRDIISELSKLGYTSKDLTYLEVAGGRHNFQTWSKVFPQFLRWAFVG